MYQQKMQSKPSSFRKLREIGRGGQGVNWLVERKQNHQLLVRKSYFEFKKYNGLPLEPYILEQVLDLHPRIIPLESCDIISESRLDLFFPFYRGGDLTNSRWTSTCGHLESFVWHVFIQMADALAFLRMSLFSFDDLIPTELLAY